MTNSRERLNQAKQRLAETQAQWEEEKALLSESDKDFYQRMDALDAAVAKEEEEVKEELETDLDLDDIIVALDEYEESLSQFKVQHQQFKKLVLKYIVSTEQKDS